MLQVFQTLDRWCQIHGFDGDGKKIKPVKIIAVTDGRIDPTKVSRNAKHDSRQQELAILRDRLASSDDADPADAKRFKKLRREAIRYSFALCIFIYFHFYSIVIGPMVNCFLISSRGVQQKTTSLFLARRSRQTLN